jgi:adenosylhomocysteine nucleosidase
MDVTGLGYEPGQVPQLKVLAFPADNMLRVAAVKACREAAPEICVFEGRVVSGDQFICERSRKDEIAATFGGLCTEMEGAAIAQAAYLNNIPYLVVRAISDKADDSANMDYSEFEAKAVKNSVRLMAAMIAEL